MADNFKELYESFKEVTSKSLQRNKDRSVVKLLNTTVKSLETLLSTIDAFLKKNGVDVGKAYEASKEKGKSFLDKGKDFIENAKKVGIKNKLMDTGLSIKTKLEDTFSSFMDKDTGPPEGEEGKKEGGILDKLKSMMKGQSEGTEKKSWLDKLKEKQDKRKNEVEEEKKSVQDKMKANKKDSWLGKILSGIMSLGGFLISGFGKILGPVGKGIISSVKFLGGFLTKGFSKILFNLVPSLSGGIAKGLQSTIGTLLKAGASGAWGLAKTAASSALPFLGNAAAVVGRGAMMLATGPVGWAVAAGTALYAGYKLYKYLTRNDVADNIYGKLTRLRLLMYGFNDVKKEYFSKIFDLEMLMKDYVKFNNYKVQISKLDKDVVEKVLDLFSVSRDEKEKYAVLNKWFMKRFIPSYKAFLEALYSINNNIYLDNLDKLKITELDEFLVKFKVPGEIFKITEVPTYDNTATLVTKEDIDTLVVNISNDIKSKLPKEKDIVEKAKEENKQYAAKQKVENLPEVKKDDKPPTTNQNNKPNATAGMGSSKEMPASPDQEGEDKGKSQDNIDKASTKAAGKLNIASGNLLPGSKSLEGITTKLDKAKIYNLDPNVFELFTGMAKEYNNLTGKSINVNQAFRSYEDQAALYKKMPEKAAKPGNSTHEFGLAIDIDGAVSRELDKLGLLRKYGFSTAIGKEDWHIEPIGVTMNPTLAKNDPNFRFKAIQSSPGNGGGGYGFQPDGILKKRDINFQTSIYNSNSANPIDVDKIAANSKQPPILDKGKTSTQESSKGTETTKPNNPSISVPEGTDTRKGNNQGTEIPKTKTPVQGNENTPSLNKNPDVPQGVGGNMDLSKYANLSPEEAVRQAAKMTGMDENTLTAFAKLESSFNKNAKAKGPGMTASGLFGITDPTWKGLLDKYGSKYGIPKDADKNNPFYNSLMAAEYAKENLAGLKGYKEAKLEESTALYLAHHFGLSGANKIIKQINSKPDATMEESVSSDAYKANYNELKGQTVSSYIQKVDGKLSAAGGAPATTYKASSTNIESTSSTPASKPIASASVNSNKPSISSASYNLSSQKVTAPTPEIATPQSIDKLTSTAKLEDLMSQQLNTLTQIASTLTSLNDKFDLDKLAKMASPQGPTSGAGPLSKSVPNTIVNLTRKRIET